MNKNYPSPYTVFHTELFNKKEVRKLLELEKDLQFQNGQVGNNIGKIEASIRRSNVAWLDQQSKKYEWIYKKIFDEVRKMNHDIFGFEITGSEHIQYTVYDATVQGTYNWHTDTAILDEHTVRKLSITIPLSSPKEYDGGNILFMVDNCNPISFKQVPGRMFVFPSNILHCVTPIFAGTRKSLVLWLHGPKFK